MIRRFIGWLLGKQEITINLKVSGSVNIGKKIGFDDDDPFSVNNVSDSPKHQNLTTLDLSNIQEPDVKFGEENS